MSDYHKRIKKRSQNIIKEKLSRKPLTFSELLDKTGLSRGVLNTHLKELESDGAIEKKYESGKIVNVLVQSEFDIVEWFIDQLRKYDIPEDVLEKGKKLLSIEVLTLATSSTFVISTIIGKIVRFFQNEMDITLINTKNLGPKETLHFISPVIKKQEFNTIFGNGDPKINREIQELLNELNPYSFTVFLSIFKFERLFNKHFELLEKESPKKINKIKEFFFVYDLKGEAQLNKSMEDLIKWWKNEVQQYLPNVVLFVLFSALYVQNLQYISNLIVKDVSHEKT